jgi:hypothetical protein
LSTCRQIAEEFADDGYKFAISGPHLTKTNDTFKLRISFGSSHDHKLGSYMLLWMHANVRSSQLRRWRQKQRHPYPGDDWVAGGMAHGFADKGYFEWNLAEDSRRSAIIAHAIEFIRAHVLPYFNTSSDPPLVISKLCRSAMPAFEIGSAVEFALCFGNKEQAQHVLNHFVTGRKDLADQIAMAGRAFRERGFPPFQLSIYADQIAWVRTAYDLN